MQGQNSKPKNLSFSANNLSFKQEEEAGFDSDQEETKRQMRGPQKNKTMAMTSKKMTDMSEIESPKLKKNNTDHENVASSHVVGQSKSLKKESKTIHIIKQTLQRQLMQEHPQKLNDNTDQDQTLEQLQKLMVEFQAGDVQIKEREEMQQMAEGIKQQRNKYKQEATGKESAKKIEYLIARNIKSNLEDIQKQETFIQKKRYLNKRTKEIVKIVPEFMVSFNDTRRTRWDVFVIILTIYNCFYIPFEISFTPPVNYVIEVINSLIDLIFYIDIILNLRTTFMTQEGEEVMDKKLIARKYMLHGTFFVDVLSILPLNALIPGDFKYLDVIGMLKLVRITRLSNLIQKLDLREDIKAFVRVCQLTFLLIFYFHLCTCLWFFEARFYEIWIPAIEFGTLQTDVFVADLEKQYFTTMHYSVLLLTGNEMGPRTDFENFLCALYILCGALISANIFGEMAVLVQMIKRKNQQFQEQIDSANTAMKNIRLPPDLSTEIRDYLVSTQSTLDQQQELDKFLGLISPSLKLKVSWQIFEKVIRKNPVFSKIKIGDQGPLANPDPRNDQINNGQGTDLVSIVVRKLQIQLNGPEDIIIKQGDFSQDIYFIAKGDNYVTIKDTQKKEYRNFAQLTEGDHFGEISMIYGCPRTASIMSNNYCTYAKLSPDNYKLLLSEIPEVEEEFKRFTYNYTDKHKFWLSKTMRNIPIFVDIEDWAFHRLIYSFNKRVLDKGAVIFKPQEEIQHLRIVQDGIVDIYTHFENNEFIIEKLMRGSLINQRTFVLEETAQVYARAARTSIILELSMEDVNRVLADSPIFEKKFLSYQHVVLNSGKQFPIDYILKVPKVNIIDPKATTPDRIRRMIIFKLAVMRRIQELRIQKSKPKLSDLLKELKKGGPVQKMEVKRKILALYEFDDEEKAKKMKDKKQDEIEVDPQDKNEKNKTYLNLKMKLKKIIRDLEMQENALESMNQQMVIHEKKIQTGVVSPMKLKH